MTTNSAEHMDLAEKWLDAAENVAYSNAQLAAATVAIAHIKAATFRKAEEDKEQLRQNVKGLGFS